MKSKQIAIALQRVEVVQTSQSFDRKPGQVGEGPWTIEDRSVEYHVIKMRNACVIDLGSDGPNKLRKLRVGDVLSEPQAEEIARMKCFEVSITA